MRALFALTVNELIKIFSRPRASIVMIVIVVLVGISAFISYKETPKINESDWRDEVQTNIQNTKDELNQAKQENLPEDLQNVILQDLQLYEYYLENDISPYEQNVWGFMEDNGYILFLIIIFSIIVASDTMSNEYSRGTIKSLLLLPVNKSKIVISKFLSCVLLAGLLIMIWFTSSFIVGGIVFGGIHKLNTISITMSHFGMQNIPTIEYILKNVSFNFVNCIIFISLSIMISTLFRSNSLATTTSILLFIGSSIVYNLLDTIEGIKYTIIAHLNLNDFMYSNVNSFGFNLLTSLSIILVHLCLFQFITIYFFKRDSKG